MAGNVRLCRALSRLNTYHDLIDMRHPVNQISILGYNKYIIITVLLIRLYMYVVCLLVHHNSLSNVYFVLPRSMPVPGLIIVGTLSDPTKIWKLARV